jgi:hypothetical protein
MQHHDRSPESPLPNRRQFLLASGSTVVAGVIAHSGRLINEFTSPQAFNKESQMKGTKASSVFCQGFWADGSCFSKVIPALQADGHQCIAAQYSLSTTNLAGSSLPGLSESVLTRRAANRPKPNRLPSRVARTSRRHGVGFVFEVLLVRLPSANHQVAWKS